ncbi:MAG: ATPase [Proteobacteria bacterium]|nr:ATPase [Pseudomonadota bacterium]MBU4354287.1 ATPase [Pseudomonadota bacterium]MBU4448606.1 ATPase [Pseudomonadota bacterium]MCG2771565.1 acyl-CoA dehydratase activase [Desulfobacterales bacterium]
MSELYLGIDLGASATKAVLLDSRRQIVARTVVATGLDFTRVGQEVLEAVLRQAGADMEHIRCAVATGYGRKNVHFPCLSKTEISCHGRGAYHYFPEAITVVDIGGQDTKIIRLGPDGRLLDFQMNRKCAAGTGAFLEEMARRLDLSLSELEQLAGQSQQDVKLGSYCTVFTFTEILALSRRGIAVPDLVKAIFNAIVQRVTELGVLSGKIVATGGVVAYNPTVANLLANRIGVDPLIPPEPQLIGALGAALFAFEEAEHA